jgi:hypothetical protein
MDTIPELDAKISPVSLTATSDRVPPQAPPLNSDKFRYSSNKFKSFIIDKDRNHSTIADVLVDDSDDSDSDVQDGDPKFDIEVEKALSNPSKSRTLRCKPPFPFKKI